MIQPHCQHWTNEMLSIKSISGSIRGATVLTSNQIGSFGSSATISCQHLQPKPLVDCNNSNQNQSRMITTDCLLNIAANRTQYKRIATVNSRTLCHKSKLPSKNTYHWPYEKRSWGWLNFYLDPFTKKKFDDNTKIIQVEGNVAAGKEEFAKQLANELGMCYFPQVNLDDLYINQHGYDYRALNPLLPERMRFCDMEMFHENPTRHSVIHMQHHLFKMRLFQYLKALRHLFNTGQGVILTRSVFTERVFVEAMHDLGWLPMGYLRGDGVRFYDWKMRYNYVRNLVLALTMKPHLTIYLDTPVDTCLERIKNDPDPMIANSNALTREFLEAIESAYKNIVLPKQNYNMHVMMVDHPESKTHDEIMDVVDDIEELNFEFDHHDTRFEDWNPYYSLWHANVRRNLTTMNVIDNCLPMNQPYYDIAGLGDSITHADLKLRRALYEGHVGPFGYFQNIETDTRIHGAIKAYFGWKDFGERLDRQMRIDFA